MRERGSVDQVYPKSVAPGCPTPQPTHDERRTDKPGTAVHEEATRPTELTISYSKCVVFCVYLWNGNWHLSQEAREGANEAGT